MGMRRPLDRATGVGRAIIDAETGHYPDIESLDPVAYASAQGVAKEHGFRAALVAPMLREGAAIGSIVLAQDRGRAPSRRATSRSWRLSPPRP